MMSGHAWQLYQRIHRALQVVDQASQTLCERTAKFLFDLKADSEGFMDGRPNIENTANALWDLAEGLNSCNEELNTRWKKLEDTMKIL